MRGDTTTCELPRNIDDWGLPGRWTPLFGALLAGLVMGISGRAPAMDFSALSVGSNDIAILCRGEIFLGDTEHFITFIRALPHQVTIKVLMLDSPGGSILEAERLATEIHEASLPVAVVSNATCASACFMLFASSPLKYVSSGAQIGVHSASIAGGENILTQGVTTMFARDAKAYGVPPDIIGRMVTTEPDEMAWLSPAELGEMGARFLSDGINDLTGSISGTIGTVVHSGASPQTTTSVTTKPMEITPDRAIQLLAPESSGIPPARPVSAFSYIPSQSLHTGGDVTPVKGEALADPALGAPEPLPSLSRQASLRALQYVPSEALHN